MFFSHNNLEGFILVLLSANIQKRRLADGGFHDVLSLIVGFACYKTFFTTNSDTQTVAGACEKAYFPLVNISTFHQWNSYKRRFNGLVYQIAINYNKKKPLMRVTKKEAKVDRKPWKLLNWCGFEPWKAVRRKKVQQKLSCLNGTQQVVKYKLIKRRKLRWRDEKQCKVSRTALQDFTLLKIISNVVSLTRQSSFICIV